MSKQPARSARSIGMPAGHTQHSVTEEAEAKAPNTTRRARSIIAAVAAASSWASSVDKPKIDATGAPVSRRRTAASAVASWIASVGECALALDRLVGAAILPAVGELGV